jgi:hypothetical protein
MDTFRIIFAFIFAAMSLLGMIWFLVEAFRKSAVWFIACLCVPFVSLIFLITNWREAKYPFALYFVSAFLAAIVAPKPSPQDHEELTAIHGEASSGSDEAQALGESGNVAPSEPAVAAVEAEPFPDAPAELRPLHWRVISQDANATLLQQATGPTACKVTCTLKDKGEPVWSSEACLATRSDPRFVSNDCERLLVLTALPTKGPTLQDVPVAHVYGRAQREFTYKIGDLIRDPDSLRVYSSSFHWLQGVSGTPGSPPHYREDAEGVDFTTVDDMAHSLPFYPSQTFIELLEPGAEPRTLVQYQPGGQKVQLSIDLDVAATIEKPGSAREVQRPPPLRFTLELAPGKAEEGAPLPVAYKVKTVKLVNKEDAELLTPQQKADIKQFAKVRGQLQIAPNGLVTSEEEPVALLNSDGALMLPQLHAAIAQSTAVFPKEPIGKGARWHIRSYGMGRNRFSSRTCSLTALEGGKGSLTCEQTGEARSVPMRMPGLVPGASLWAKSQELKGDLSQSFDLTQPVAASQVKLQLQASVLAAGKGRPTAFDTQILTNAGVDVSVLPAKAKGATRAKRR